MAKIDLGYLSHRVAQSWATIQDAHPLLGHAVLFHKNTRQGALSFRSNPYLVEMYADFPHIDGADLCKGVQLGLSELIIQLHMEASGWRGRIAALVLPTWNLRDRFVQQRINPLLEQIPEYRERAGQLIAVTAEGRKRKGAENLKVKRFGEGAMLFLGSNSAGDFVEFSTDLLTVDEFDHCDATNLAIAKDRLRNSPYPQFFRIGNPTSPKDGIASLYEQGDRRLFHWRCTCCGERQPIDWFINVVMRQDDGVWVPRDQKNFRQLLSSPRGPDIRPVCRRCHRPFERKPDGAAWVAAAPGRRRSYRLSRLDVITDRLWDLFFDEWLPAQRSRTKLKAFYNSVLGLPYEDAAARVTHEHLSACATGANLDFTGGDLYKEEMVVAGIDVGAVLNVVVDAIHLDEKGDSYRRAIFVTAVSSFDAVKDILNRYNVQVAVIDAYPETRASQALRDWALYEQGTTTVWLCQFYPNDRAGSEEYGTRVDFQSQILTVNRTQLLDATFDEIISKRRVFPADAGSVPEFWEQMQAPVRKLDDKGARFIWSEGSAADHYRLADAYARVAADQAQAGGGFVGG